MAAVPSATAPTQQEAISVDPAGLATLSKALTDAFSLTPVRLASITVRGMSTATIPHQGRTTANAHKGSLGMVYSAALMLISMGIPALHSLSAVTARHVLW